MMHRLLAVLLLLVLSGAAAGLWCWNDYQRFLESPANLPEGRTFSIEKGTYFNTLVNKLEAESIIDRPLYLKALARLEPELAQIKAGEYALDAAMTPRELLAKFSRGDTLKHQFTIIEGTRFSELRAALAGRATWSSNCPSWTISSCWTPCSWTPPRRKGFFWPKPISTNAAPRIWSCSAGPTSISSGSSKPPGRNAENPCRWIRPTKR